MTQTHFASPERTSMEELKREIQLISGNPFVIGVLNTVHGLLAVVNENRQIVALNDSLADMLGLRSAAEVLGMRPGEAMHCIYAADAPSGCGTGCACANCGAVLAVLEAMQCDELVEKTCALSVQAEGRRVDRTLKVRARPIRIGGRLFALVFLEDAGKEYQRAALERTFFHDINNMITALVGLGDMLVDETDNELAVDMQKVARRLMREVSIQQCLSRSKEHSYSPQVSELLVGELARDLQAVLSRHPASRDRRLELELENPGFRFRSDPEVLSRILFNMVLNALEASARGDVVRLRIEDQDKEVSFHVWNRQVIPASISERIFQKSFSTKCQDGRGIGTFSMKLFGEEVLGGKVSFDSRVGQGTWFHFRLPLRDARTSS